MSPKTRRDTPPGQVRDDRPPYWSSLSVHSPVPATPEFRTIRDMNGRGPGSPGQTLDPRNTLRVRWYSTSSTADLGLDFSFCRPYSDRARACECADDDISALHHVTREPCSRLAQSSAATTTRTFGVVAEMWTLCVPGSRGRRRLCKRDTDRRRPPLSHFRLSPSLDLRGRTGGSRWVPTDPFR